MSSTASEPLLVSNLAVPQLFPRRAAAVFPAPNGKDVSFSCSDDTGLFFICKPDRNGHPVRATELILTRVAEHLGIRTARCAVIEHDGMTFFGSQTELSTAGSFQVGDFLMTPNLNELGQPLRFPGEHLAQLLAFDLFISNPDRGPHNFLLVKDGGFLRLCAIDFADARLSDLTTKRFPVAGSTTVIVGRRYRKIHGAFASSSVEMVDRIAALSTEVFSRIVAEVPDDWLTNDARGGLNAVWGSPGFHDRLAALRSGLISGTLV